jgi:hypothetical protein
MPKFVELDSREIELVAGGDGCIDTSGPPTVQEMIERMMNPVPTTVGPIN